MAPWTVQTLYDLDARYAEEGVHPHQRAFRAAIDILGGSFLVGAGGNPEVQRIIGAYEEMLPEARSNWPGMGTGIAAVVDQVRRLTAPVVYGTANLGVWEGLGFNDDREWRTWCREDARLMSGTCFAFADLLDLTYGLDELKGDATRGSELWRMAASNVSDFSNTLPGTFGVDSVVQPICLAVELSLKAALVANGEDPDSFRRRGGEGHDLVRLAKRVAQESPHRDDPLVAEVAAALPGYVDSRYAPVRQTRLKVVRYALGAQFVAASTVRRHSARDIAAIMEVDGRRAPRLSPLS